MSEKCKKHKMFKVLTHLCLQKQIHTQNDFKSSHTEENNFQIYIKVKFRDITQEKKT